MAQPRICSLIKMKAPEPNRGLLFASGTVVPADATDGYQTGCLFQHTDGTAEGALYVNEGSVTSCDFNAVVPAGTTELADLADVGATAYTAGSILVGSGTAYAEVAVSGQATLASSGAVTIPLLGATAGTVSASKAVIASALKQVNYGGFNTSAALTLAVPLAANLNQWTDGQLDVLSIFGGTSGDLTSAYSAKCVRARHVVNAGDATVAQETYGAMGQLVVKDATLGHLHAGLIGTFEGHTSGCVVNGAYKYGVGAVAARVGGGAAIAATKDLCGYTALWNGAAMASGESVALAIGDTGGVGVWTHGIGVERCTNLLDLPAAGTDPVIANALVPAAAPDAGTVGADACLRVLVNNVAYYIPLYDTLHA